MLAGVSQGGHTEHQVQADPSAKPKPLTIRSCVAMGPCPAQPGTPASVTLVRGKSLLANT